MRKVFYTLLSIFLVTAFQSCQQEVDDLFNQDENGPNPPALNGDLRAKLNGVQWVADKASAAQIINGRIAIAGFSIDKKTMVISLQDSGVHRYMLTENTLNAAAFTDSTSGNPFALTTNQGEYPLTSGGEVNVTAIDTVNKKITGTFSFKMLRQFDGVSMTVTEGSFNLAYTTSLAAGAASDTLRAKVNGASFDAHSINSIAAPSPMNSINVSATSSAGFPSLGLTFPTSITPGSYTLDFFGGTHIGSYSPDTDGTHTQGSTTGTLVILEHNPTTKRIRGNFSFHAERLLDPTHASEITEGYFSVKY